MYGSLNWLSYCLTKIVRKYGFNKIKEREMSISKKALITALVAVAVGAQKAYAILLIVTLGMFSDGLDTFDDDNSTYRHRHGHGSYHRHRHGHTHHRGHRHNHSSVVVASGSSDDAAGIFAFFIILDGDQGVEFSEITADSAGPLGVGPHEAEVFNESLDEINMTYTAFLLDTHKKGLSKAKRKAVWNKKFRPALDEETAQVFEKVAKANAQLIK